MKFWRYKIYIYDINVGEEISPSDNYGEILDSWLNSNSSILVLPMKKLLEDQPGLFRVERIIDELFTDKERKALKTKTNDDDKEFANNLKFLVNLFDLVLLIHDRIVKRKKERD